MLSHCHWLVVVDYGWLQGTDWSVWVGWLFGGFVGHGWSWLVRCCGGGIGCVWIDPAVAEVGLALPGRAVA